MAAGHTAHTSAEVAAHLTAQVAQAVEPYVAQDKFPGISVAVVRHGHVVLARGYGVSNVGSSSPVEADTRFDIGSVTKTFTAIGVLMLYQQGQGTSRPLDLDAPIGQYLHNTRTFKLPPRWAHVTTRELLDMSSGIRDVGGSRPWESQLASIANAPLLYTPGTKSSYSSANYDLLGELIEQWTGEKYATFVQNEILNPLGLSQTRVLGGSATVPDQAVGYAASRHGKWPKDKLQNGAAMYAAAGMVSTAEDMGNYMVALLGGQLLSPATYAMMWSTTPRPQYSAPTSIPATRGLGWDNVIDAGAGPSEVAKSGLVPGFSSELLLFPSTDSGIFVSLNTSNRGGRNPGSVTAYDVAESIEQAIETPSSS
jgi:CubicO group peptidase (beta-lactamase class C family)